jgi:hypothetical protein
MLLRGDDFPLLSQRVKIQEPGDTGIATSVTVSADQNSSCPAPLPSNPMDEVELSKAQVCLSRFALAAVVWGRGEGAGGKGCRGEEGGNTAYGSAVESALLENHRIVYCW